MSSQLYTPSAGDATYPSYAGIPVQDPTEYTQTSPERCDAKYFGLAVQNELLRHQELLILASRMVPVWGGYALIADVDDLDLDVDDYNRILITPDADAWEISGIVAPVEGTHAYEREIVLMNASDVHTIVILADDAQSAAANRILVPNTSTYPFTLLPYDSVHLSYDVVNEVWRQA